MDYPTIQVLTFDPGASPDVMVSSVTTPLERPFGQLPGLRQMASTSSSGASLITLQFTHEYQIDVAEQQVQAAINIAPTFLPKDLPSPPIYSKVNPADTPILTLALTAIGIPTGFFTPIFAASRTLGWMATIREQWESGNRIFHSTQISTPAPDFASTCRWPSANPGPYLRFAAKPAAGRSSSRAAPRSRPRWVPPR